MKTLPDYLRPGLRIVSIGLNPSLPSVAAGFYFANPRNRFWSALTASGLAPANLEPGPQAVRALFEQHGMGFTDVVKRPSAGGAALRAADFKRDAPALRAKLAEHRPEVAWFHGKQAYEGYLRYAEDHRARADWGAQAPTAGCRVFVTPNPSPANAAFSLHTLIDWYRRLASFAGVDQMR
ncbi:MAG: mismatch-specific DNA-glycosylase [Gammaproteobacteria bacterium]|nr:mismatch-specific DNA-glycosylase [Gammaproteobacteria bacterium]